jgi:hypothetical protein
MSKPSLLDKAIDLAWSDTRIGQMIGGQDIPERDERLGELLSDVLMAIRDGRRVAAVCALTELVRELEKRPE